MRSYSRNSRHNCRYYLRLFSHDFESMDWWTLAMALSTLAAVAVLQAVR